MNRALRSLQADYFEALYNADPDPWQFHTSAYEADKYAATLQALPRTHYTNALEIGCSIGVLTRLLAPRCDRLLALDGSARALRDARRHCAGLKQVDFQRREVPRQWPRGRFDLILFSEILYYLDNDDLNRTANLAVQALRPGGDVLLVHWTGTTDYPLSGDEAAEGFMRATGQALTPLSQTRAEQYRLDLLRLG